MTLAVIEWEYEFHSQSVSTGYLGQASSTEISAIIQNLAKNNCCSSWTHPTFIIRNQTTKLF